MFELDARPPMIALCSSELAKQTTLIISNEEMNDTMRIVKCLEESGLLIKRVSETIQNEAF